MYKEGKGTISDYSSVKKDRWAKSSFAACGVALHLHHPISKEKLN
jgi:hypothetical protein